LQGGQPDTFPAAKSTLCIFAAYLARQGLKHQTIKSYLSAVRHLQIEKNCFDPFNQQSLVKLELVLKGIERYQLSCSGSKDVPMDLAPMVALDPTRTLLVEPSSQKELANADEDTGRNH